MKPILKQASFVFFAQVLTRAIGFFYTIYLARTLGVADFGLYTVALSYFSIVSSIADFGINRFLIREIAKDKSLVPELFCNVVILRLTLTSILFAIFSIILYFYDPDKMRVSIVLLATLSILPQSIALTLDAIFTGIQKLQYSAISLFFASLGTSVFGFLLVGFGYGPIGAANALIFGQIIYVVVLIILLLKTKVLSLSKVKITIIKKTIAGSLPYGLLGILGLFYFRIDSILLSYMRGSFETGIYGAAYKFLEAVAFIPSSFSAALFPVLSRMHDTSPKDLKKVYFKSLKFMLILGVFILLGYLTILPEVIKRVLPGYLDAIIAIKILSISIPFMLIHVPAVIILLSSDKYLKQIIMLSIFTLLFNLILNITFIPKYGYIGASWITVISEVLSFVVFFIFIKKNILGKVK